MTIYMALAKDEKSDIIKKFAREKGDTGSPEVQIALLSMVAKRRRLLSYLQKRDEERYKSLIKELKLDK